jgi:hypothetical protein
MAEIEISNVDTSQVPEELAKALQPIVLRWQTAALKVASGHGSPASGAWTDGSAEELLDRAFGKLAPPVRTRAASRADTALSSARLPVRGQRVLGVDVRAVSTVPASAPPAPLRPDELQRLLSFASSLAPQDGAVAGPHKAGEAVTWDKISLQFVRVACLDETNGFLGTEKGSDEISIGGAALDSDGNTSAIAPIDLGGQWDDDDVRDLVPATSVTGYSMRGGRTFPRALFVTLVLVERDGSGMQDIIDKIVAKVAEEAKTSLTALLAAAAGGAAGGPVGALIGLAVGYAIDRIVDKITRAWEDDVFIPQTVRADIPSRQAMFAGRRTSPSAVVRFRGPGEYACRYQWHLSEMA